MRPAPVRAVLCAPVLTPLCRRCASSTTSTSWRSWPASVPPWCAAAARPPRRPASRSCCSTTRGSARVPSVSLPPCRARPPPTPGELVPCLRASVPPPAPVPTGDGGNDVSMIQAADCGIGIEGKVRVPLGPRGRPRATPSVVRGESGAHQRRAPPASPRPPGGVRDQPPAAPPPSGSTRATSETFLPPAPRLPSRWRRPVAGGSSGVGMSPGHVSLCPTAVRQVAPFGVPPRHSSVVRPAAA